MLHVCRYGQVTGNWKQTTFFIWPDDDHDDVPTPVKENEFSSPDDKPVARTTRSKMRVKPAPPKLATPSSDDDVATPTCDTVGFQPPSVVSTKGPGKTTR